MEIKHIQKNHIDSFLKKVLQKFDLKTKEEESIVDHLIEANLLGVDSHGIQQIFGYVDSLTKGRIKSNTQISTHDDLGYLVKVNGNGGPGQWVGNQVVDLILDRISKYKMCFVSVTNSNHFGMAGYFTKKMAENNLISYVTSDTNVVDLIPFDQSLPKVGNNPVSYGFPILNQSPFILDMALGEVSGGKVKHFGYCKKETPSSWTNQDGKNVSQSRKLSYLALISDLFCGPMIGTIGSFFKEKSIYDESNGTGHIFIAYDPTYWADFNEYSNRIEKLIFNFHDGISYPGQREEEIRKQRIEKGIPLPMKLLNKLQSHFPNEFTSMIND
jgi:LDH2 family malate/lactate/ureidoglycolate dehydrogenase